MFFRSWRPLGKFGNGSAVVKLRRIPPTICTGITFSLRYGTHSKRCNMHGSVGDDIHRRRSLFLWLLRSHCGAYRRARTASSKAITRIAFFRSTKLPGSWHYAGQPICRIDTSVGNPLIYSALFSAVMLAVFPFVWHTQHNKQTKQ